MRNVCHIASDGKLWTICTTAEDGLILIKSTTNAAADIVVIDATFADSDCYSLSISPDRNKLYCIWSLGYIVEYRIYDVVAGDFTAVKGVTGIDYTGGGYLEQLDSVIDGNSNVYISYLRYGSPRKYGVWAGTTAMNDFTNTQNISGGAASKPTLSISASGNAVTLVVNTLLYRYEFDPITNAFGTPVTFTAGTVNLAISDSVDYVVTLTSPGAIQVYTSSDSFATATALSATATTDVNSLQVTKLCGVVNFIYAIFSTTWAVRYRTLTGTIRTITPTLSTSSISSLEIICPPRVDGTLQLFINPTASQI